MGSKRELTCLENLGLSILFFGGGAMVLVLLFLAAEQYEWLSWALIVLFYGLVAAFVLTVVWYVTRILLGYATERWMDRVQSEPEKANAAASKKRLRAAHLLLEAELILHHRLRDRGTIMENHFDLVEKIAAGQLSAAEAVEKVLERGVYSRAHLDA
jgi:hypothetical protein